jgi:MFS family permease
MRLERGKSALVVVALGVAQTIAWGSSYYLPAVLANPIARELDVPTAYIFGAFSMAMAISAAAGPRGGHLIDRYGGRRVLVISNMLFSAGLILLGMCSSPGMMFAAWAVLGLAMGIGLYEAAFATLAGLYGHSARSPITGITLIAGFASTVGWPLSGFMDVHLGWRGACFVWAALHLLIALPLNALLPDPERPSPAAKAAAESHEAPAAVRPRALYLLAFVFAAVWFNSTAMASHLPRLLEAAGATSSAAIAAGALIGPAQVAARLAEFGLLRHTHPLALARWAAAAHPAGVALLLLFGAPISSIFVLLHGAGNGILTITKGTLPLVLFGPVGYGLRLGLLDVPARLMQAFAPLLFGLALDRFGAGAALVTAGLGIATVVALLHLARS